MREVEVEVRAGGRDPSVRAEDGVGEAYRLWPPLLAEAKIAWMARHLDPAAAVRLVRGAGVRPRTGDLMLARVLAVGHHRRLETADGRKAALQTGDPVVLACGGRYAPDQFRGVLAEDLRPCALLASGGLAGRLVARHDGARAPTRIAPLGLLADGSGRIWNTRRLAPLTGAAQHPATAVRPPVTVVAGTAMNGGKTTVAAALVRGWKRLGLRVAAVKASGTASAGDRFAYLDAGADVALDPGDAGWPTTADLPFAEQWRLVRVLLAAALRHGVDRVVLEVADGVLFADTGHLVLRLFSEGLADRLILAAADAAGACAVADWARERGLPAVAVSGAIARSPLAMDECRHRLDLPVLPPDALASTAWLPDDVPACARPAAATHHR